jgi:hypothetical protein
MISKWSDKKPEALQMRQKGESLRAIEKTLRIPKSTLSVWFRGIKLDEKKKGRLHQKWRDSLIIAREKAAIWHNQQKELRMKEAEQSAEVTVSELDIDNFPLQELAVAMLYLGEGVKANTTCIANSNPLILRFFLKSLWRLYSIDPSKVKCELHLRADQDAEVMKLYWSNELQIPVVNFTSVSFDKRTLNRPTYDSYKGVCVLRCGNIAIQRKLVYLSRRFCEKIIAT